MINLAELGTKAARCCPHAPALIDAQRGKARTFAELSGRVQCLAVSPRNMFGPGQRVAVLSRNCFEMVELYLACAASGALLFPMNWELSAAQLRSALLEADPVAIFGSGSLPEAGSLLRHPFLAVSTGGTTGIPKSVVRNQLSYAACTLNYLAVGGCTAAPSAPGTPTATHTSSGGRKKDVRKTGICCVADESTYTLTGDPVSTTFVAAGAGGRTEGPLTKPASNSSEGGR